MTQYTDIAPSRADLQSRRERAVKMFAAGQSQAQVAAALHVSKTSANRWARQIAAGNLLTARKPTGRPRKLSPEQLKQIAVIYGAGNDGRRWTAGALNERIFEVYAVRYSDDHVVRLIQEIKAAA